MYFWTLQVLLIPWRARLGCVWWATSCIHHSHLENNIALKYDISMSLFLLRFKESEINFNFHKWKSLMYDTIGSGTLRKRSLSCFKKSLSLTLEEYLMLIYRTPLLSPKYSNWLTTWIINSSATSPKISEIFVVSTCRLYLQTVPADCTCRLYLQAAVSSWLNQKVLVRITHLLQEWNNLLFQQDLLLHVK